MRYLLDTNICIHLFKGQANLIDKIESIGLASCYLSELTIAELMYGVENGSEIRRVENWKNLESLYTTFADRILLIGQSFPEYSRQKTSLRRAGRMIGEFDLFIGSTAISHGLTLATRNVQDFARLERIELENWID
ncbi:PIN domain-containing protein [Dyadobacter sp. CY343]|uniref:PIN domain-containing protein n=1 Tax=Dyadobacter sp. CY343 TaxID=2907299 RepID=UPI001F419DB9|nr:PIN domain-containing protein [Dyadobacter sp. CY343]MCE7059987.1 PIN domain-containing protein [Dyadobacter sp. CY343]